MSFVSLFLIKFQKAVKRSNQLGTRFFILLHRTSGESSFVIPLLIKF